MPKKGSIYSLRQPGYPYRTRGFASPDCSGFASVGAEFKFSKKYQTSLILSMKRYALPLLVENYFHFLFDKRGRNPEVLKTVFNFPNKFPKIFILCCAKPVSNRN